MPFSPSWRIYVLYYAKRYINSLISAICPNDGWEPNSDGTECVPVSGSVSITCNPDSMTVSLDARHLYVELDAAYVDAAESAAFVGSCVSTVVQSSSGIYSVTVPLDDCDTEVTQADGEITFTNKIFGSDGAITVDGIIITEKLELDVTCSYTDSFDLTASEVTVEGGDYALDGTSDTGDVRFEPEIENVPLYES